MRALLGILALVIAGCGAGVGSQRLEVTDRLRSACSGQMTDHELQRALFVWETDRQQGISREQELATALRWRCDYATDIGHCQDCIIAAMNQVYGR